MLASVYIKTDFMFLNEKELSIKMNKTNGNAMALDDMDVMAFAKNNFKDLYVDRFKKHEVTEGNVLYRFGNDKDDDVFHMMVTSERDYMAYREDDSGAMKKFEQGKI